MTSTRGTRWLSAYTRLGAKRVMKPGSDGFSASTSVTMLFCPGAMAIGPYS